ncbi:hypothetical protein [Streptomyces sp. NPDC048737]|uniref:hypothetical protein n=1 Tax=unclassified Streptomyces TaxID=2593676 RepID=UPI00341F70BF
MWRTPLGDEGRGIESVAASGAGSTDLQGRTTVYEYEIQQARSAELLRRAAEERLAREAVRGRRAARREAAERAARTAAPESEPHTHRPRRPRSARTA